MDEYLIRSMTTVGNSVLWWNPDKCGYTTNPHEAGVFTKEFADKICLSTYSRAHKKEDVLAVCESHVDANKLFLYCRELNK